MNAAQLESGKIKQVFSVPIKGKMADIVVWDRDPFSTYSKTEKVFIDGVLVYNSVDLSTPKPTDFELGILEPQNNRL